MRDECWCCGGVHDSLGLLCPDCDDWGCQYFSEECQSDHKPVFPDGGTDTGATDHEEIVNQRWIAKKLRSIRMVKWDRFTIGEWDDEQYVNVYGWIERNDDDYKDFVNVIFWPENEVIYHVTSSAEHSHEISQQLHGEEDDHNDCLRVEHTFDVSNAVELVSDGGTVEDDTERPEGWPEHYHGTPTPQCDHHMMWDTADGQYGCIYECGKTADEPPASKIDHSDDAEADHPMEGVDDE